MINKEKFKALMMASWAEEILFWLKDNEIKTEKGDPIEFVNRRFLQDIYNDWTPIQVSRKASQVGWSTMAILKSAYAAKYKNWNIIYTLPSFGDVGQFVPSKVNPIIQGQRYNFTEAIRQKFHLLPGNFKQEVRKREGGSGGRNYVQ